MVSRNLPRNRSAQLVFSRTRRPVVGRAATWKFMDIPTSFAYLGKMLLAAQKLGNKNDPALAKGQYSLAIGYPRSKSESAPERETKDKKTEADYKDSTLSKKRNHVNVPRLDFSGKMRLFMQSIYGAKEPEKKEDLPFIFDPNDIVPVGMFKDKKVVECCAYALSPWVFYGT